MKGSVSLAKGKLAMEQNREVNLGPPLNAQVLLSWKTLGR